VVAMSTWGAISSVRPLPFSVHVVFVDDIVFDDMFRKRRPR